MIRATSTPVAHAILRNLTDRGVRFWLEPCDDGDSLCWRVPRRYSGRAVLGAMLEHGPAVAAAIGEILEEAAADAKTAGNDRLREIEALLAAIAKLIERLSK